MASNYDVYMCRERDYSIEEADFKLRVYQRILNDITIKDLQLETINSMVNVAWVKHLKLVKFANKKGA